MTRVVASTHREIAGLQPGERLEDEIYLIGQKDLRTTSNGSLYIHAVLVDKSGQLLGRMWNASEALYEAMTVGGFMHFRGRVESYKGKPQFIIEGMRAVAEGAVNAADFLPTTERDIGQMWARVLEILRGIQHPDLLALVARFINDKEFAAAFQRAPAAVQLHHAYIGGLLEHTLNLLELALVVVPRYPELNLELVLAALFLHDCGKTRELTYDTNFGYTNEGQLVGHLALAASWVDQRAREVEQQTGRPFPRDLLNVLKHIILSHHGQYEFGSPKLPATPEAIAVHYLDNLDAKIHMFLRHIARDNDDSNDWTEYIPAVQTRIFKLDVTRTQES